MSHQARGRIRRFAGFIAFPGLVIALGAPATAQISPNGPEFQVNQQSSGPQSHPVLIRGAGSEFIAVWHGYGPIEDPRYEARRYGADGVPLGPVFRISGPFDYGYSPPRAAADAEGNFVVVWESSYTRGNDSSETSIQGRRFRADGVPLSGQFQVNSYTFEYQLDPVVASNDDGEFVVAWAGPYAYFHMAPTARPLAPLRVGRSGDDIRARRFDAEGHALGPEIVVDREATGRNSVPAIAYRSNGGFVVVWTRHEVDAKSSIRAQRFSDSGVAEGSAVRVNESLRAATSPDVAATPNGGFVVVWTSRGSLGLDDSETSVQGRRFDSAGEPLSGEFQINTSMVGTQDNPRVAVNSTGGFQVTWESESSRGSDFSARSVQARRYLRGGTAATPEFQVNAYTTGRQFQPAVLADRQGNWIFAWESDGSRGADHDLTSIQARRFDALFRDGFELHSTSRWDATESP